MSDLRQTLTKLWSTKSAGQDGITMKLIKQYRRVIEKPLLNIINSSISSNTFPDSLKIAKIIPKLKPSKDSSKLSSYRPINLLPALSKVIESVVGNQLKSHINKHGLIPENHTGSRKFNSTTTAAMTLHDIWTGILRQNQEAIILQLDQSAAYDIICH